MQMIFGNKDKLSAQIKFIEKNNYFFHIPITKYKNKIIEVRAKNEINYNDILKTCEIGLSSVILKKRYNFRKLVPKNQNSRRPCGMVKNNAKK